MSSITALRKRSVTMGSACTGTMPALTARLVRHPVIGSCDATLRGIGMTGFANNPLSGLLFATAVFTVSPWLALAVGVGGLAATLSALVLGIARDDIRAGLYGYNGVLVGGGFAIFLSPSWSMAVVGYIVSGAVLSTVLMAALMHLMANHWGLPPVALPFNILVIGLLLAAQSMRDSPLSAAAPNVEAVGALPYDADVATPFATAVMHGIGQVLFAPDLVAAALVLTGIVLCCWQNAVLAILGSATATFTAIALGVDSMQIDLGLFGLNGFLTCVALGGVFVSRPSLGSALFGIAGAAAAAVSAVALNRVASEFGLPGSITLGYCGVTALLVSARVVAPRLAGVADTRKPAPAQAIPANAQATAPAMAAGIERRD